MNDPTVTLIQGQETEERIEALLSQTRIRSELLIKALKDHFVNGAAASMAYMKHSVNQQNFERAAKKLIDAHKKNESGVNDDTTKEC
ncbi:hypothetical protein EYS14_01555 [Alteromonadaceae bacterium M269]|nr:hypothetical protein EYS14_01555 [Alteromonadaceae bacterium M269]